MYVQIPPASSLFFSNIARRGSSDVFSKVLLHRSSFSLPFFWSFFWCQATSGISFFLFFLLVPGYFLDPFFWCQATSWISFFFLWCQAAFLLLVPGYFYFWCQAFTSGARLLLLLVPGYFWDRYLWDLA
jgi:hypothetical protein